MSLDPWAALQYPLTVRELERLSWIRMQREAAIALGKASPDGHYSQRDAKRLAFARYLYQTHHLSEEATA